MDNPVVQDASIEADEIALATLVKEIAEPEILSVGQEAPLRTRTRILQPVAKEPPTGKPEEGTLAATMAALGKLHGPNIIRPATQALSMFQHLRSNIFMLDMALFGGIPESLQSMVYGWESAGKSVVATRFIAAAQKKYPDKRAVLIDQEGTFIPSWGKVHGVDIDSLVLAQPESGEQAVDVVDAVIRSRDTSLVVVDSLPSLMPFKEMEKSAEDNTVALQARLIGILVRKASQAILDERKKGHIVSLFLINQWRSKITLMGDPRSLPGGNALKFFVANRFEVMNKEFMGVDARGIEVVDHNDHSFKITKNKLGNGIRTGAFTMIRNPDNPLGVGYIDEEETVLAFAKKFGMFSGGGGSYRMDDLGLKMKVGEWVEYLYENSGYCEALKLRLIREQRRACGMAPTGWE